MASTLRSVFGLSILLLTAVGCGDSGGTGPQAVGGSGNSGGSGGSGNTGLPEGTPLTPMNGWVDGTSNDLGIQGALFEYADSFSAVNLMANVAGPPACLKGTAAKVEMGCQIVPPATDCYGTYWGAALGLNLNQPIDPATNMGVDPPLPYDAEAHGITGFAFMVTGTTIPLGMRFKVENDSTEFCTPSAKTLKSGPNALYFNGTDLVSECWTTGGMPAPRTGLIKIAWHVVTNASAAIPFDFCIEDIRVLTE
jgi:hypothetical protein